MHRGRSSVDGDDDVLRGSDVVALKLAPILTFARAGGRGRGSDRVDVGNGGSAARMRAIKMKMRLEAKGPVNP